MRFTIRDLLWLTLVVALGVAWWVDRWRLLERIDELDGFQTVEEWLSRGSIDSELPTPTAESPKPPKD